MPDIENPPSPVMEVRDGSVEFDNVDFSYHKKADNCILKDINLKIKSGQVVGVIGSSSFERMTETPFDTMVNSFIYYNCDNERGRYPAYYIED